MRWRFPDPEKVPVSAVPTGEAGVLERPRMSNLKHVCVCVFLDVPRLQREIERIHQGSSWGLRFFRFLGAEFFRFLGDEFFRFLGAEFVQQKKQQNKQKQQQHSPSSEFASSGPWVCFFFFWCLCSQTPRRPRKPKKKQKHSPSSEDNTLLMLS